MAPHAPHALDALVARHDLNAHPFYLAWRAGTLPRAALAAYAAEYAPFIASVEEGWRTIGDAGHALAERDHARLWGEFRDALGAASFEEAARPACPETAALVSEARRAFADPVLALGALYAFEAQQPGTARSKLEGLRAHYAMPEGATRYFEIHAGDYGERDRLGERLAALPLADRARAEEACERVCVAMWSALDGVFALSCPGAT